MNYAWRKDPSSLKTLLQKRRFLNSAKNSANFWAKVAPRETSLYTWVEIFLQCFSCRYKGQDMGFHVVYFISWLVSQLLRGGELNMTWNREKNAFFTTFCATLGHLTTCTITVGHRNDQIITYVRKPQWCLAANIGKTKMYHLWRDTTSKVWRLI